MRKKGIFEMAGNYEPQIAAPLDARNAVESKADLTNPATWQDTSGAVYLYDGLLVAVTNDSAVENNGIYKRKCRKTHWKLTGAMWRILTDIVLQRVRKI